MGAYRCSIHFLNFPLSVCPVVGCDVRPTWHPHAAPTIDWEARAVALSPDVPFIEPPVGPVPDVDCDIHRFAGMDWVPHDALIAAGYRNLEDFQVVRIGGGFWELQGHIGRTLTHGIRGGAWWVEQVHPEAEAAEFFKRV